MGFNFNHVFGGFNCDQVLLFASVVVVVVVIAASVIGRTIEGPVVTAITRHDQWFLRSCHCRHHGWAFVARRTARNKIVSTSALRTQKNE